MIKLGKTIIFVYANNISEWIKMQNYLMSMGYKWVNGLESVDYDKTSPYFLINWNMQDGDIILYRGSNDTIKNAEARTSSVNIFTCEEFKNKYNIVDTLDRALEIIYKD